MNEAPKDNLVDPRLARPDDRFSRALNMDAPKISVIIVSYNFEKYIKECIESVLAQTLTPFEIIICDDHSTDNSWDVIAKFQELHSKLIRSYRRETNLGARNNALQAIEVSSGDLISIIDGDDRWLPGKLGKEWSALKKNPAARIAYSNVYTIDANGHRTGVWYDGAGEPPPSGDIFVQLFSGTCFPTRVGTFRQELMYKSVIDELGYDENVQIFLDIDIKIRATARFPVIYSGEALVEYRHHSLGIHNRPMEEIFKDMLGVYLKNMPLLASRSVEEAQQIRRSVIEKMFRLVQDVQDVCDERLQLINRLDDECKRILKDAEDRLALIRRLESEIKEIRKVNFDLQNTSDERLRMIEAVQKIAAERLELIESLDAKVKEYERSLERGTGR